MYREGKGKREREGVREGGEERDKGGMRCSASQP